MGLICITYGSFIFDTTVQHYCKGHRFYDFWSAVIQPDGVSIDSAGKILCFKDKSTRWGWSCEVEELYIRECYKQAIESLNVEVKISMISGTPGIGKSLFIFYFIYAVVSKAKKDEQIIPTFLIANRDGAEYFFSVDSDENGIVHEPITGQTPDYLITDTLSRSTPLYRKQYIHVSSNSNVGLKDFRKTMMEVKNTTIYMPVFSLAEYFEIDGGEINEVSIVYLCCVMFDHTHLHIIVVCTISL